MFRDLAILACHFQECELLGLDVPQEHEQLALIILQRLEIPGERMIVLGNRPS